MPIRQPKEFFPSHWIPPETDYETLLYFSFLRYDQRQLYLDKLGNSSKLKRKIENEQTRISRLRHIFRAESQTTAAGSLLYLFRDILDDWRVDRAHRKGHLRAKEFPPTHSSSVESEAAEDYLSRGNEGEKDFVLSDLNANIVYFRRGKSSQHLEPYYHENFLPSKFPDQKLSLSQLLSSDHPENNPLMWQCEKDMIRYFHIPSNNMEWIEVDDRFTEKTNLTRS